MKNQGVGFVGLGNGMGMGFWDVDSLAFSCLIEFEIGASFSLAPQLVGSKNWLSCESPSQQNLWNIYGPHMYIYAFLELFKSASALLI